MIPILVELIALLSNPSSPEKLDKACADKRSGADEAEALVAAYSAGVSVKELAAAYQLHRNTVAKHLDRHSVVRRQTGLMTTDINAIVRLYRDGWSLARIGQRFDVRPTSVRYRLQHARVALRPRNGWSEQQ
jgi:DNA-directed RNA polymerase specialized sigma24 family protein